jgi:hypothetical protein
MLPNKDVIAEIGKFKSGINKGNFKNCKNKNFDPRDNDLFKNAVHLAYLDAARTFSKINSSSGTAEAELAKAKSFLGNIRSTYTGINLPGGAQMNGDNLMSQGKEEQETLRQELLQRFPVFGIWHG